MMRISGASDDLICIEGDLQEELCVNGPTDILIGDDEAKQGQNAQGVILRMEYAPEGLEAVWSVRVAPLDEDVPIPWKLSISAKRYTVVVEVDCPKDTPIRWRPAKHTRSGGTSWRALRWTEPEF